MFTINDFKSLDTDLQAQVLWLDGVYLDLVRHDGEVYADLYALYDFYVEVFFDKATEEPTGIRAFKNPVFLEPYLDAIDIHELLEVKS